MMEKRNVVEPRRTPDVEIKRADDNWDKQAAAEFDDAVVGPKKEEASNEE